MTPESRFDSVGWIFLGVAWLLLLAPAYYAVSMLLLDTTPVPFVVGTTVFLSAFGAAFFTWIVNSILGYVADRRVAPATTTGTKKGKSKKNSGL